MGGGLIRGVGLNDFPNPVKQNGVHIYEYRLWHHMLERCYSDAYQLKQPTYTGCTVEPYLLSFNNFFNFVNSIQGFESIDEFGRIYQMDKDILIKGNKEYSRNSVCFVPKEINAFFNKHCANRGNLPIGVLLNKSNGKFRVRLSVNGEQKHLGYFTDKIEAFKVYKEAKEAESKVLANKWKGAVDERVYNALIKYEVDIND